MFEQAMSHYLSLNLKKSLNQSIAPKEIGFVLYVGQVCNQLSNQINMTDENRERIVKMYQSLNLS
jgi:hypothetical protein